MLTYTIPNLDDVCVPSGNGTYVASVGNPSNNYTCGAAAALVAYLCADLHISALSCPASGRTLAAARVASPLQQVCARSQHAEVTSFSQRDLHGVPPPDRALCALQWEGRCIQRRSG